VGSPGIDRTLRALLCAAGIGLALVSMTWQRGLRQRQEEMGRWLEGIGIPAAMAAGGEATGRPGALRLSREPDPEQVRLYAARMALAAELDPSLATGRPPLPAGQGGRASAARLAETARLAEQVFAAKPAAWEAAMILGAARYLSWSQGRDPRLFTRYREWEDPLETALGLAPGRREPVRFLAGAYLEIWPVLAPGKRREAREILAEVFRNPRDLQALLEPWIEAAGTLPAAFSIIPDNPEAWRHVEDALAGRADLAGWSAARERRDAALLFQLRRDLARAEQLLQRGEPAAARSVFLSAAGRARPDGRYREILETALTRCPPGPVDRETGDNLLPHLLWAVDRCLFGQCALSPAALERLAFFARDAEPAQRALAALFAGDLPRAESFERQGGAGFWNEAWAPYLTAKARSFAERGRFEEARVLLTLVPRSWQDHPLYWQARVETARAAGDGGGIALAESRLAGLSRTGWPAFAWTWRRGQARLEMLAARPGRLAVALDEVPTNGGAVELRLDGTSLGAFPVPPRGAADGLAPVLLPRTVVSPGLHLLEIESLLGRALPGSVALR
jgi:hypothetical protein